jgi:hypothetical protein
MLCNLLVLILQHLKKKFGHENIKKTDLKSRIIMAVCIFFLCSHDCPKQPIIEYLFYRFLYPMICGTISGLSIFNASHHFKMQFLQSLIYSILI